EIQGNSLEPVFALAETVRDFIHLEGANDIALFLDDSFRKVAPQKLSYVDSNAVAVFERRSRAHGSVTHDDGTIRFNDLQHAHPLVVIAKNLQQHVAAGAGCKENIVGLQPARIVRNP